MSTDYRYKGFDGDAMQSANYGRSDRHGHGAHGGQACPTLVDDAPEIRVMGYVPTWSSPWRGIPVVAVTVLVPGTMMDIHLTPADARLFALDVLRSADAAEAARDA